MNQYGKFVKVVLILHLSLICGCASVTGKRRVLWGIGLGGGAGATGGALLSPNNESQGLNALVFGLGGAIVGGLVALFSDPRGEVPTSMATLRAQDQNSDRPPQEFQVLPEEKLPNFLKSRIQPLVIEEFVQADSVAEDGSLHEPHKVYRVKHPGELFARPSEAAEKSE